MTSESNRNLLERCFFWFLSKWGRNSESHKFKHLQCPLCGATKQDVGWPSGPALYLGHARFPRENHVTSIEDAVDKDVSV